MLALLLAAPLASAGLVSYTVEGRFTGTATDDATMVAAINPLLAGQALTMTLTLDTAAAGSPALGGGTLYRAITGSATTAAGFATTGGTCPSVSDLICTAVVRNGGGGFFDPDHVNLFPSIEHSDALDAAAGLGRRLDLQFMLFFTDVTAGFLADEGLPTDLTRLDPALIQGQLGVFALNAGGFDRASFAFDIHRISTAAALPLPESGSLALVLLGLLALRQGSAIVAAPPRRRPAPALFHDGLPPRRRLADPGDPGRLRQPAGAAAGLARDGRA